MRVTSTQTRRLLVGLFATISLTSCDAPPKSPTPEPAPVEHRSAPESRGSAESSATSELGGEFAASERQEQPTEAVEPAVRTQAPTGQRVLGLVSSPDERAERALAPLVKWVDERGGKLHVALADLDTSETKVLRRDREPVNPASNMKVMTAAAALELLGPAATFRTELRGTLDAEGRASQLVLRGGGDPSLTTEDLVRLVRVARQRGLRRVGDIVVDQSRFDDRFVPPRFGDQPNEWAAFRAPVSALSLERNAVTLNVESTKAGEKARVWYEPPGVVAAEGEVTTSETGGDRVRWNLDPALDPRKPRSLVGGQLAAGLGRRKYSRRLEDPRAAGGHALRSLLGEFGVEVSGEVKVRGARADGAGASGDVLAFIQSAPLAELLLPLGKESDNFTAEMVLIALSSVATGSKESADPGAPWSTARGAERLLGWLASAGIPSEGVVVENGSGLFDANRLTALSLTLTLARMEASPEIYPEFLAQLAVYGRDGTLASRQKGHPLRGRIRAKTGTLHAIDALSGYVLRPGRRPLAFSIIVSGVPGRHGETRARIDDAVFGWATTFE